MARRPRSHQIEDISARLFEQLLPHAWVSRHVTPDYGVDREVEIFTTNGEASGLKFAVQLKATDRHDHADRVALDVSALEYLIAYALPAIVVRYDATNNAFRWQWVSRINSLAEIKKNQKSFTHRFNSSDIWNDDTPLIIERELRARLALATFPRSSPMPVRLIVNPSAVHATYFIRRAVGDLIQFSGGNLTWAADDPAPVEILIKVRDGLLSLNIDMLDGMTFDIDTRNSALLTTAMLYALAWLFARKKLHAHALAIGRAILAGRYEAGDARLVARASYAFADHALEQAELAILNGLHLGDSLYYMAVMKELIRAAHGGAREGINRFLNAALEATQGDSLRASAVHYSMANAMRRQQPARALYHYNRARHLRQSYLDSDYFLSEVGEILFNAKRYHFAVQAYQRANAIAPSDRHQFCLGDALLFIGEVDAASRCFELTCESDDDSIAQESIVKLHVCRFLSLSYGPKVPTNWSRHMGELHAGQDPQKAWLDHLGTINALDPLANFNLGSSKASFGEYNSSLSHFVICAIVPPHDTEAWKNSIISAFREASAGFLVALIHLSIRLTGHEAYDALRTELVRQGADILFITALDDLVDAIRSATDLTEDAQITMRLLDKDAAEIVWQTR